MGMQCMPHGAPGGGIAALDGGAPLRADSRAQRPDPRGGVAQRASAPTPVMVNATAVHRSHWLAWFWEPAVWACIQCGAMGQHKVIRLGRECAGKLTKETAYVIKCLQEGKRPYQEALSGGLRARPVGLPAAVTAPAQRRMDTLARARAMRIDAAKLDEEEPEQPQHRGRALRDSARAGPLRPSEGPDSGEMAGQELLGRPSAHSAPPPLF